MSHSTSTEMGKFYTFYRQKILGESTYVRHNQNPFGSVEQGDCVIRALSQALEIPYEEMCKMMHKRFIEGKGQDYNDPVNLQELRKFAKETKLLKEIEYDIPFLRYVFKNEKYEPAKEWETLEEFTDSHRGKYIVLVRQTFDTTKEVSRMLFKQSFHVVYVDGDEGKYYDLMKNDPHDMIVYGYFKVNN